MIKILHSADWHLDSPILGRSEAQTALLKAALLEVPHLVAAAAKAEQCDLMLLSGDIFDGQYTPESLKAVKDALEEAAIPVFISPGNHDFSAPCSPWADTPWPENVHIFRTPVVESYALPALDCRVYGAAFAGAESASLLENFRAEQQETYALGVFHGDPTQASSPYAPVTAAQISASGLHYLALGHIHKGGSLRAGDTLCAWPGCPMGRGFDELDAKGVLAVTLDSHGCETRFIPLQVPRFYDLQCPAGSDAADSLSQLLPAVGSTDFYRISLTGESEPLDLLSLERQFSQFPNLSLRDRTVPPIDLWASAGEDTLEGVYFRMLQQQLENADEESAQQILLAAKISRQLLEGREVTLP